MTEITLDRLEGDRALLIVGGEAVEIPAAALPAGAGEGCRLKIALAPPSEEADARGRAEARLERLRAASQQEDDFSL